MDDLHTLLQERHQCVCGNVLVSPMCQPLAVIVVAVGPGMSMWAGGGRARPASSSAEHSQETMGGLLEGRTDHTSCTKRQRDEIQVKLRVRGMIGAKAASTCTQQLP